MMNSGGLKIITIAIITISCLVAMILGTNSLSTFTIRLAGIWAINELI